MTVVVGGIVPNEAAVMLLDLVSSTTFSNGIVGTAVSPAPLARRPPPELA